MRRLATSFVFFTAAVAAAAGSAFGADGGAAVTDSSNRFPERSLRIELPERQRLNPANVKVTENGGPVSDLKVTAAGEQTVAMLLIDASLTMKGEPMTDALRAARAFAARRNPAQRIGIATFNAKVEDLLPFTSSQSAINTALAKTPQTAYGTVIYDAVEHAAERIQASGAEAGTIVLLADGQNVGSKGTLEEAIRRLKQRNIRLFSVALRSPAYYGLPLRRMARTSGGSVLGSLQLEEPGEGLRRARRASRERVLRQLSLAREGGHERTRRRSPPGLPGLQVALRGPAAGRGGGSRRAVSLR